jgi:hypothetical protein
MPKAMSTINFWDEEAQETKHLKVVIHNDYSVDYEFVGGHTPQKETIGDKVEGFIDKVTGGQLKKCGGCERRKKLLDKMMGEKDDSETSKSSGDVV